MSKSRAVGTRAESEVVKYLRNWWPAAERRALSGALDKGDVAGIPGLVVEVKAAVRQELAKWQRETYTEMRNAGAARCMLVAKRPYRSVAQWDAYLRVAHLPAFPEGAVRMDEWVRMDLVLAVALLRNLGH